jgi:hypothetical protein
MAGQVLAESCPGSIGFITLGEKCAGARSAGNPHAACEVAGAGNGATDVPKRARRGKPRIRPRDALRATAPAPDPTFRCSKSSDFPSSTCVTRRTQPGEQVK